MFYNIAILTYLPFKINPHIEVDQTSKSSPVAFRVFDSSASDRGPNWLFHLPRVYYSPAANEFVSI